MGLAGAAVADGDDVLAAPDVFAAGQFCRRALFTEAMAVKSKVSKLFTAGNRAARMRRSTMR